MGEVHIGPVDEASARTGKPSNKVRVKGKKKKKVEIGGGRNVAMVPLAFIFGGFSLFVGGAIKYHMFTEGGLMPVEMPIAALEPYIPYTHLVIGALLAMLFTWSFGFDNTIRRLAVIAGFAGLFYYEPAVISKFPGTYITFYSEAYVADKLGTA